MSTLSGVSSENSRHLGTNISFTFAVCIENSAVSTHADLTTSDGHNFRPGQLVDGGWLIIAVGTTVVRSTNRHAIVMAVVEEVLRMSTHVSLVMPIPTEYAHWQVQDVFREQKNGDCGYQCRAFESISEWTTLRHVDSVAQVYFPIRCIDD